MLNPSNGLNTHNRYFSQPVMHNHLVHSLVSVNMEDRFYPDDRAEFALSSMVTMIMILLFSSIVAGMSLMIIEQAFKGSKSQAVEQSETLNSIPLVLTLEMDNYDSTGNTNDRLYIVFKFPYASSNIPDTNVKWALICDNGDTSTQQSRKVLLSEGDFDFATTLTGNALDQNALNEFEPHTYYHMILRGNSPNANGECDLEEGLGATLIIAVENGRTTEIDFFINEGIGVGEDLMS